MERWHFDSGNAPRALAGDASLPDTGFVWLDMNTEEVGLLEAEIERLSGVRILDDHSRDARNETHPSFFDNTDQYEIVIFRGLVPGEQSERVQTRPMVLFNFDRLLVSIHERDSPAVEQVRQRFTGPGAKLPRYTDELMHRLISTMVDRYLELRHPLTMRLERMQRELLNPRKPYRDWLGLLQLRGELRRLEELCEGQVDAVQEWRDHRFEDMPIEMQVRFSDLMEHITRVLTHVRRIEEQAESAVQLHFSAMAFRTSEIMRMLTLITAVFLPLTVITGVFGMNFQFIPGLHSVTGFWWSLGAMLAVVAGLLLWFKFKRWF